MVRFNSNNNNKNEIIEEEQFELRWKRRPSEVRGYVRTLYTNASNGDYLRVDYNLKDKKVRLFVEDSEEGGLSYYSVIHDGRITTERNMSTGRNVPLRKKFSEKAEFFATIPNREVLKIIGLNYGINSSTKEEKARERKATLETTKRKYFADDNRRKIDFGEFSEEKGFSKIDLLDIAIGAAMVVALYKYSGNFRYIGVLCGFYAMLMGIFDMFFRGREPLFIKILIFLISGVASYVYGYYYL